MIDLSSFIFCLQSELLAALDCTFGVRQRCSERSLQKYQSDDLLTALISICSRQSSSIGYPLTAGLDGPSAALREESPKGQRQYQLHLPPPPGSWSNGKDSARPSLARHPIRVAHHGDCALPAAFGLSTRVYRSEEHTSELQSQSNLVCRLL